MADERIANIFTFSNGEINEKITLFFLAISLYITVIISNRVYFRVIALTINDCILELLDVDNE
jgi:hypothetical protein